MVNIHKGGEQCEADGRCFNRIIAKESLLSLIYGGNGSDKNGSKVGMKGGMREGRCGDSIGIERPIELKEVEPWLKPGDNAEVRFELEGGGGCGGAGHEPVTWLQSWRWWVVC